MARILMIGVEPVLQAQLQPPVVGGDIDVEAVADPQHALTRIEHGADTWLVAIIGPQIDEPVRLAQWIHRLDREISILILSEDDFQPQVNRAIQFTPFLGDHVASMPSTDIPAASETLQDAVLRGRQRRRFRTTVASMNERLGTLSVPRISATQYLDHVLDYAPIGVVALDADRRIISSNRRAGEILEQRERELLGHPILELFAVDERDQLADCIARAKFSNEDPTSEVFSRRASSGDTRFVSVIATALRGDGDEPGRLMILEDVTRQVIYEREREEALRLRDEFLSVAAHELKTPLTSIKGFVDLLGRQVRNRQLDQGRIVRLHEQVQVQIDRLELLVADLLDVTRIQQGRLDPRPELIDLADLANQVVQRFLELPETTPQHELILEAPEPVEGVWDPYRLDQVITNLVSNALKYSSDGGEVGVTVHNRGSEAELVVYDYGVGIDPEQQSQLFQPFMRGDSKGNVPGTGLGLYITHQIIEQHGGTISVDSTPGEGTAFIVRLPLNTEETCESGGEAQQ